MIALKMPAGGSRAGRLLRELLRERGVEVYIEPSHGYEAVVCYGTAFSGIVPCLNDMASQTDKLEQLQLMKDAGVPVPRFSETGPPDFSYDTHEASGFHRSRTR